MANLSGVQSNVNSYLKKIEQYKDVKNRINNLINKIENCSNNITLIRQYTDRVIVNSKTIDDDKLISVQSNINNLVSLLNSIIAECNSKIYYYLRLSSASNVEAKNMKNGDVILYE